MKKFITFLSFLFILAVAFAVSTPVFVFQKDGKIDMYDSDEIISIETIGEKDDIDSPYLPVSHNIILQDTVVSYPIENIDSVSFGSKSIITPKTNVKRIQEAEFPYIKEYRDGYIHYELNSPKTILPQENQKIYHDTFCDLFPYGLCGIVESVTETGEEIKVKTKDLHPSEVFDEYFISGDFELSIPVAAINGKIGTRAETSMGTNFNLGIDNENIEISSQGKINIRIENFVGSPVRNFYHADIFIDFITDLSLKITSEDSGEFHLNSPVLPIRLGTIGGVLFANLDLSLFLDFVAECGINYEMHRNFSTHYEWERNEDYNSFKLINNSTDEDDENKAVAEFMLNGYLHLGPQSELSLQTLFNFAGAGVRAKIGPKFQSEFGMGIISQLSEDYDSEIFAKAKFTSSLLTKIETYVFYNDLMMNRHEETLPFGLDIELWKREHQLLPDFSSKSVKMKKSLSPYSPSISEPVADITSEAEENIEMDLEVGYQMIDRNNNNLLYEGFLEDKYIGNSEEKQEFTYQMPLSGSDIESVIIYPVVRYGDFKVKCAPTSVRDGYGILPIFYQSASANLYTVAGASVIGDKVENSNLYIVGNMLPVFSKSHKKTASTIQFIDETNPLIGKWETTIGEEHIEIQFNEDFTCIYNNIQGEFEINKPQGGYVRMAFPDDKYLILGILELNENEMTVKFGNDNTPITFKK